MKSFQDVVEFHGHACPDCPCIRAALQAAGGNHSPAGPRNRYRQPYTGSTLSALLRCGFAASRKAFMNIEVKLFYDLSRYLPPGSEKSTAVIALQDGATIQDLMDRLQIPDDGFKSIFVNGLRASFETRLKENDAVAFFPPMAGG